MFFYHSSNINGFSGKRLLKRHQFSENDYKRKRHQKFSRLQSLAKSTSKKTVAT